MFEQQNFDSQTAPDSFAFKAALDVQGNDVSEINSLPFPLDFAYGLQSQGDPRVGDNVPYSDHRHLHLPDMESGNSFHFLPQPMHEIDEILIRLDNMKYVFYEHLRAIEELIRRIHVVSPSRAINPVTQSHHTGQFGPTDFGKLSQDAMGYIPSIASSSILGTAPSHTEPWTTAPAVSFPFDSYTDSNKVFPQSPIYEIIVDGGVKYFRCGCGHQTKTKADMIRHHKCLKHSEPSYFCGCGKRYTRDDALDRHQKTCRRQGRV